MSYELSCRRARSGGFEDRLYISEGDQTHDRLVILIHGFNNSREDAERAYRKFQRALDKSLPPGWRERLGPIWQYHWPGDHPSGIISAMTYSTRVPVAQQAGPLLAREFIAKLQPDQSVYLVAHSLGCRVALEAVRWIRSERAQDRYGGASVDAVFLLAAAVPMRFCELSADDATEFPKALEGSEEHVFFSAEDRALGWWFTPGQYAYGEPGRAVGLHGEPPVNRWASRKDTRHGHGDYWTSPHVTSKIGEISWVRDRRFLAAQQLAERLPAAQAVVEQHAPRHVLSGDH